MAALCRSVYTSRLFSNNTQNRQLGRRCSSIYHSSLKCRRPPPRLSSRAFESTANDDNDASRRNKPRIQLSRKQIRRLWEDLGRDDETAMKVDSISVDPDRRCPIEMFGEDTPSFASLMVQGRISVDPDDFPVDLFESEPRHVHDRDEVAGLKRVDDLDASQKRMEADIEWYLKRARRDVEPHRYIEKAQSILERWHEEAEKDPSYPTLSWQAHENILRGWKRIGLEAPNPHAAERADYVLQLLLNLVDERKLEVQESLDVLFTWVIRLWLRASQSLRTDPRSPSGDFRVAESVLDSATRACDLLMDLEHRSYALNDEKLCKRPEGSAYSAILKAFNNASIAASESGFSPRVGGETSENIGETAAQKSEEALVRMIDRAETPGTSFSLPDADAFRAVLSTWANVNSRRGLAKAQEVLEQMEEAPYLKGSLDVLSYRRILLACARLSRFEGYDPEDSEAPVNKALSLLVRLDPELLPRIRDVGYVSFPAKDEGNHESKYLIGDTVCHGAVIQALAQADVGKETTVLEVTPADLAVTVMDRMEEQYSAGKLDLAPNSHCYGNVIRAHCMWASRSVDKGSLATKIERVLKLLEDHLLRGEQISASTKEVTKWYNQAIRIVAQQDCGGLPSKANKILERMEELYSSTGWSATSTIICPDEASYCLTLSSLEASCRSSGDLQNAHDVVNVLRRMIAMHDREQKDGARRRSDSLCRPSAVAYNIVLRTCALVSGEEAEQHQAFGLTSQVFDDLQASPYTTSNSTSYALVIKAHASLLPAGAERDEGISKVFQRCDKEGKLDKLVMNETRQACSEDVVKVLLDSSSTAT